MAILFCARAEGKSCALPSGLPAHRPFRPFSGKAKCDFCRPLYPAERQKSDCLPRGPVPEPAGVSRRTAGILRTSSASRGKGGGPERDQQAVRLYADALCRRRCQRALRRGGTGESGEPRLYAAPFLHRKAAGYGQFRGRGRRRHAELHCGRAAFLQGRNRRMPVLRHLL